MTQQEQEKLFEQVRNRFPNWGKKRASGYVHGIQIGLSLDKPESSYLQILAHMNEYAKGYLYGFLDAYGVDALKSEWFEKLFGSVSDFQFPIHYRWWDND